MEVPQFLGDLGSKIAEGFQTVGNTLQDPGVKENLLRLAVNAGTMGGMNMAGYANEMKQLGDQRATQQLTEALGTAQSKWEAGDTEGALKDLDTTIGSLGKSPYAKPETIQALWKFRLERGEQVRKNKLYTAFLQDMVTSGDKMDNRTLFARGLAAGVDAESMAKLIPALKDQDHFTTTLVGESMPGWAITTDRRDGTVSYIAPPAGGRKPFKVSPLADETAAAFTDGKYTFNQIADRAAEGDIQAQAWLQDILALTQKTSSAQEPVFSRRDITNFLIKRGWRPEDKEWEGLYINIAKRDPIAPGGASVGRAVGTPSGSHFGDITVPDGPRLKKDAQGNTTLQPAPVVSGQAPTATPLTGGGGASGFKTGNGVVERMPSAEQTDQYVSYADLTPAKPGTALSDLENPKLYRKLPLAAINKLPNLRTAREMLDGMEKIINKRDDLWPVLTGDKKKDSKAVTAARFKWKALAGDDWLSNLSPYKGTDADVSEFASSQSGLPGVVRGMGDVGNIAQNEQAIQGEAAGLKGVAGKQAALARINTVRRMLDASVTGVGLGSYFNPKPVGSFSQGGTTESGLKY